ncbi:MAG: DUF2891 domain-containing protein [Chitinophagaceae bacterium]
MKYLIPGCILFLSVTKCSLAQVNALYHIKKDSSGFELTAKGASLLASLPLKCIIQQYPNKTGHIVQSDSDQVASSPKQLHPVFYGCFDWHSSVHGHWMLVSLLKMFPQLPEGARIRETINNTFTPVNMQTEVKYLNTPLAKSWERTYGWAWLLRLDEELYTWNDEDARRWHTVLQPLTQKIIELWTDFLPKQTYPNRTGVHPNTAFGLVFALDYARTLHNTAFEKLITATCARLYGNDKNAPTLWEPDGSDFLSPTLEEADLMRRVLSATAFRGWLNRYISPGGIKHLTRLPIISDRTDLQIVHLDGLCFSRSWCMRSIAAVLPKTDQRKKVLNQAARQHLEAALPNVVSGNYGGEHWLASFAVLALLQ